MCGICGYLSRRMITKDQLSAMNDTMIERGPDDAGVEAWELPDGRDLGMAQRRLSILDLSMLGHQPMSTPDGRVSLVYNGEIYNFREIRKEIPEYPFRSNCDTEVILAAYRKWGIRCVERFNGMFAFALYDRESGELFLARDRMGQKPLYYWMDGENLVFASVLAPIFKCPGFSGKIRRDVLPRFLFQEYINAPETILENVYKVEPGTVLTFGAKKAVPTSWKYWDVRERYEAMQKEPVSDFAEAKNQLKDLLRGAVRRRMVADVPLGTFLSGGYDSSLISAVAQEQLGSTPLKTFSIGFEEQEYDESPYARAIAEHLGTDHTQQIIGEKDLLDLVSDLPKFFDEPMSDSSQIPTMLVSRLAKEKVTVALSGDAGDEFFCGYGIYDTVRRAQQLDGLGRFAHEIGRLPLGRGKKLEDRYPFRMQVISANRDPRTRTQFGAGSYVELAERMVLRRDGNALAGSGAADAALRNTSGDGSFLPVNYEVEDRYPSGNWQITRMLLDMDTYLPGDILAKVDRASMKYSLENRCPFLDPEVMLYSWRLDHNLKYHKNEQGGWSKKYILKELAFDYIPRDLLERPKKGFSVPLDKWLAGPLREELLSYGNAQFLREQGIFDPETVIGLISRFLAEGDGGAGTGRNYSRLLWSFFVFQQWAEYWNGSLAG